MSKSKRIEELNNKNRHRLEEGKYNKGAFRYVGSHLKYFLITGVVLFLMQGTSSLNTVNARNGVSGVNLPTLIVITIATLVLLIALTGFKLKVNRAIGEKMADPELSISESSFLERWDAQLLKMGVKTTISQVIVGFIIGVILFIFFFGLGFIGALVMGSTRSLEGALGLAALYLVMFIIMVLVMSVVVTPFTLPVEMLYTFYGEDIGVFEAVKMSFSIGWNNYGKLFLLGLKVLGVTLLGFMMLLFGLIYTLPIAQYMVIETFTEIFGVKIVRGREEDVEIEDVEVEVVKENEDKKMKEVEEDGVELEDENGLEDEIELEDEELD